MKKLIGVFLLLLLLSVSCFSNSIIANFSNSIFTKSIFVDQYFDSFPSSTSWNVQKFRLDNFAAFLVDNPDYIGYIGFESGVNQSRRKSQIGINRAVKYLTEYREIEKSRIVVIFLGKDDDPTVILQPVIKDLAPPFKSTAN